MVSGPQPERWVRQTNFDNDEAVGYLADRLNRLGVEEKLAKAGAEPGSLVRIGDREFDWEPTLGDGVDPTAGLRGTDPRITERSTRPRASDRLAARKARRVPSARPARLRQQLRHGRGRRVVTGRKSAPR